MGIRTSMLSHPTLNKTLYNIKAGLKSQFEKKCIRLQHSWVVDERILVFLFKVFITFRLDKILILYLRHLVIYLIQGSKVYYQCLTLLFTGGGSYKVKFKCWDN